MPASRTCSPRPSSAWELPTKQVRDQSVLGLLALSTSMSSWFWQPLAISTWAAPTRSLGGLGVRVTKSTIALSELPGHSMEYWTPDLIGSALGQGIVSLPAAQSSVCTWPLAERILSLAASSLLGRHRLSRAASATHI